MNTIPKKVPWTLKFPPFWERRFMKARYRQLHPLYCLILALTFFLTVVTFAGKRRAFGHLPPLWWSLASVRVITELALGYLLFRRKPVEVAFAVVCAVRVILIRFDPPFANEYAGLRVLIAGYPLIINYLGRWTTPLRALLLGVFLSAIALVNPALWGSVDPRRKVFAVGALLFLNVGLFVVSYFLEVAQRRTFLLRVSLRREKKRNELLLKGILPSSIVKQIQISGPRRISQAYTSVSVLFADLVGFTPLSARLQTEEVVAMLDDLFRRFDSLCVKHGCEKIKTIGDAYLAAAGVPSPVEDHALRIARLALAMQAEMDKLSVSLQVRIGVHTGPVVAGVLSSRKLTYDIWGDTVNLASRMESHGEPGKIHASEEFWLAARARYQFSPLKPLFIKGIGIRQTGFLEAEAAVMKDVALAAS